MIDNLMTVLGVLALVLVAPSAAFVAAVARMGARRAPDLAARRRTPPFSLMSCRPSAGGKRQAPGNWT